MADFTAKPTLNGLAVTLRPLELADVPTLRALMADPEVGRLTGSVSTVPAMRRNCGHRRNSPPSTGPG